MRLLATLSVLIAALVTGCGGAGDTATVRPSTEAPATPTPAAPTTANATTTAATPATAEARCHTEQLSARLGPRTELGGGQGWLPLVYTNTSGRPCLLGGVPGADLHGPDDPNGPVYQLTRQARPAEAIDLRPGASASARLVVLSDGDGSVGSFGSKHWVPTRLDTIPPGETTALTVPWPAGVSVLRQDAATHPGSWIEPFTGH